jgi:phosphate transport system permease protein
MTIRNLLDRSSASWSMISLGVLVALPLAIAFGLCFRSLPLLEKVSLWDVILSDMWAPMQGQFGLRPFIVSTLYVTLFAFALSAPVCLAVALCLTQYSGKWLRNIMLPVIDILAGLPSVVYGAWGVLVLVPWVRDSIAPAFGAETSGYNILTGSLVLAIMCIPFMLNMLIITINTVPMALKEASLSLGAGYWQMVRGVVVRSAAPGILAAFGLGISKALGETIAVLMVVGNVAQHPTSIFDPGYPLPALIANNYGEMMSIPDYDAALMLSALVLFVVVFSFNLISRYVIRRSELHATV